MAIPKITTAQLIAQEQKNKKSKQLFLSLTTEQMQAAGAAIMADEKFSSEVKQDVIKRLGVSRSGGMHSYITADSHTWWDLVFVAFATSSSDGKNRSKE